MSNFEVGGMQGRLPQGAPAIRNPQSAIRDPVAAARPASAPASAPAAGAEEAWIAQAVREELLSCRGGAAWAALGKRLEAAALARLACGRLDRLEGLAGIVHGMRACEYLERLEKLPGVNGIAAGGDGDTGRKALARWLLDHHEVARRLFRAVGEAKSADEALARFAELHADDAKAVAEWPDLAVAFATSEPLQHYRQQPDPPSLADAFHYYARDNAGFPFDLHRVPYELLRYLADTRSSLTDRDWARRIFRAREPSSAYEYIQYDMAHFEKGRAKRIDSMPYSLPNLAQMGGVCLDRAYFGAEACKALGVPATIVHGRGGEGVQHAWIAFCRKSSTDGTPIWACKGGRGDEPGFLMGAVRNPADGKMILDAEVMLLGGSAQLPLDVREEADAAVALARLADSGWRQLSELPHQGQSEADLSALRDLAESFVKRRGGNSESCPTTAWIAARRRIDLGMVEDLLVAAIRRDLACRPAWKLLLELRKADRLPVDDLAGFFRLLIERTGEAYPEYSCLMVLQIVPTIADGNHRQGIYERAMAVYGKRGDLKGRLLIALGDDYRDRGLKDKALESYRKAGQEGAELAEVVVPAARKAEELLLADGRQKEAIDLYRDLFGRTHPWRISTTFRTETSHYQLGSRLAELLTAAGREQEARKVRRSL